VEKRNDHKLKNQKVGKERVSKRKQGEKGVQREDAQDEQKRLSAIAVLLQRGEARFKVSHDGL